MPHFVAAVLSHVYLLHGYEVITRQIIDFITRQIIDGVFAISIPCSLPEARISSLPRSLYFLASGDSTPQPAPPRDPRHSQHFQTHLSIAHKHLPMLAVRRKPATARLPSPARCCAPNAPRQERPAPPPASPSWRRVQRPLRPCSRRARHDSRRARDRKRRG